METVETVVIGAGVVGLAVARALALEGHEVIVVEQERAIGQGVSSRNSEVIHAGLYYPTHSLKAKLCVRGKELLYAYAQERHVPHARCGKLVVATSNDQLVSLDELHRKAAANGVPLQRLTREEAIALEPQLSCVAALLSPTSGIVDSHALMTALQGDLENAGGMVALHTQVTEVEFLSAGSAANGVLRTVSGDDHAQIHFKHLINAAGLYAPQLARRFKGLAPEHIPRAHFAKGNYFSLAGKAPFQRLIYPIPQAAGLGVHVTLDLGGQAKFGPDVQWLTDVADAAQIDYSVSSERIESFYAEVRKYWPALRDGQLAPSYSGVRPKIVGPGEPSADFVIQGPSVHQVPGLINLFGIESPGLTSCLAIGEVVASMVGAGSFCGPDLLQNPVRP